MKINVHLHTMYRLFFLPKNCLAIVWITGFIFSVQPGQAIGQVSVIDSLKRQIKQLVLDRKFDRAAQTYGELSWAYDQQYGYNKYAIEACFSQLKYYGIAGDSIGYYKTYLAIGDYYSRDFFMQTYAEKYLRKGLQYFERTNNKTELINCRLALANMAGRRNDISTGLLTQLRETERMCIAYKQPNAQAYALNLLANMYSRIKRPDSSQYFAKKSLVLSTQLKISWLVSLNYFYLGLVEQFKNNSLAALRYYDKSYAIAKADKNVQTQRELSRHSADSYANIGDYKNAYAASLQTLNFTNQFYYSEQTKSIRLEELNSQIKTLAVEKQLAEEQSQHQNIINSALVLLLIISILGVASLIFVRRQQQLIGRQQAVIAQQQIRELELKSLRSMIEGQEGERSRIARDLHDGLGIQLSRIKLFVEAHEDQLSASIKMPLNQFLDEACTETRLISNNLRPYALSMFGLIPALEDLIQKLNLVNETTLVLEHYGDKLLLGDEASVMIYRVVQELLNNALKHAQAHRITTQLMTNEETMLISVDDDGQGECFSEKVTTGNGIANIRSRINYLGGQVIWQSEPGKGTSVMISIPMQKIVKKQSGLLAYIS